MSRVLQWLLGLVFIILGYGAINLVLVGGQKLWHRTDQIKVDQLKLELSSEYFALMKQENHLKTLEADFRQAEERIASLKIEMEQIEQQYPKRRLPRDVYSKYNSLVEEHNTTVDLNNSSLERYNQSYQEYSPSVDAYNHNVAETNALSKKIGGTFYVIPIPIGRTRIRSK